MIYVACPPAFVTGGPELLHQLAAKIRELGGMAMMYYPGNQPEDPVAPRFRCYDVPYARSLREANADDVLIVPEVMTHLLFENRKLRRFIWWLSVDNYFASVATKKFKVKIKRKLGIGKVYEPGMKGFGHMAQSHYAMDFLEKNGVSDAVYLSDYLNPAFLASAGNAEGRQKVSRVLYNPKKGLEFTRKIQAAAPDIDFVAIENMTPVQIADLMQTSKVYIDFGNHPGKDRIPREAAICGCCVITGLDGAAKFERDLPIPAEFKSPKGDEFLPQIVENIRRCLANYDQVTRQFDAYREYIHAEPAMFGRHVKTLLEMLE